MPTFRTLSLKNKLKVVFLLTNGVALLLASITFIVQDMLVFRQHMITELFTLADLVGANSTAGLVFNNSQTVEENIAALRANPRVLSVHVFTKEGDLFANYFRSSAHESSLMTDDIEHYREHYLSFYNKKEKTAEMKSYFFHHGHVDLFKQILYREKEIGTVYIRSETDEIRAHIIRSIGITAIVFFISLLLAFLLASKLQQLITVPIYHLVDIMRLVSTEKNYAIRGQKQSQDELGHLVDGFNHMLTQIEVRDQELAQTNQELSKTLAYLRTTQEELIQSEKMAALGQLVAGIAHEINTPLGAIRSSVGNISHFLEQMLEQLPDFFHKLSFSQRENFFVLLHRALEQKVPLSAKEERKIKRAFGRQLEEKNIASADNLADILIDMRVYSDIEVFSPLLEATENIMIFQVAYQLSGLQRGVQTITTATDRASKIVFALKNYARYDHSGEKVFADVVEGIETVLTLYHNQLKQGVEIIRHYDPLPLISCYPDELNQVWTNLIHNALQAMSNRGILTIEVKMADRQIEIKIIDSGKGIPTAILDKIFEPFFTTKPAGEGSGLGLDIVKKIINKHNGNIIAESEPGRTFFTVSLPVEEGEIVHA